MSKTIKRLYSKGYRSGRDATKWERIKWFFFHRKTVVEDWMMDEGRKDIDFLILLFAAVSIALAGVIVMWVSVK